MKPCLMWADHDPADKRTPVAIYTTKTEQRMNRPDLPAVRVLMLPVAAGDKLETVLRRLKIRGATSTRGKRRTH